MCSSHVRCVTQKKKMTLTLIHTSSKTRPETILQAIPSTRYFEIIASVKRGDTYSSVLLTTEDDAHVWGYYASYREISPVYPNEDAVPNKLRWKEKSPKSFIVAFLKATEMDTQVLYETKKSFNLVTFPSDFEMLPWLLGGIRVYLASLSSTAMCHYAYPPRKRENVKVVDSAAQQPKSAKQDVVIHSKVNPSTLKTNVKIAR